jgi:type I restriction enzyme S subunit
VVRVIAAAEPRITRRAGHLGDVLRLRKDVVHPREKPRGRATFVGLEHIESDTGRRLGSVELEMAELTGRKPRFYTGDIVYGYLRPYLNKVWIAQFDGLCSVDQYVYEVDRSAADLSYIAHFMRSPAYLSSAPVEAGPGQLPRIRIEEVAAVPLALPPLAEQRRIAALLDHVEALRAKRRDTVDWVAQLARSIFFDLFGDPITNPKGWPTEALGNLIREGPQNGLYKPASQYGEGTPIVRIDAFYDGRVRDLTSLKRVRVTEAEQRTYGLRANDLVINRVNSPEYLGKSALIPRLLEPTIFESNMMRFRVDESRICPGYLVEVLQTPFIRAQIRKRAKDAVNQSSINQQDVMSFLVRIPPLPLQQQFAGLVAAIERLKATQGASLAKMDELFASLQHRAFRGEL